MHPATEHAIADLRAVPGELAFTARIAGESKRIWFRADTEIVPPADAALAACLLPAMTRGGSLSVDAALSPRLLRTQREFQSIWRAWSLDWEFAAPPLEEVEVRAPTRPRTPRQPTGRVAAFFSGGVDSWSTVVDNPDLTDLIFVRGVDLLQGAAHQAGLADQVEARLGAAAAELGLAFQVIETNVRELSDPLIRWESYYSCPLAAIALFFEPLFDRVLIAGDTDYATQDGSGGNHLVPRLWSTEWLEVCDDGGRFNRMERTARIADHPVAQKSLRVCWENPGGAYNCGHCTKCTMTMAALEATGKLELFTTFSDEVDLEALAERSELKQVASLVLREDVADAAREGGRTDLAEALETALAKGRAQLGLPAGQRQRRHRNTEETAAAPLAQEIAELRTAPGELSFEARIGGQSRRVWIRSSTAVTPPADAALALALMPAMARGGTLTMTGPVSPRVLRNQRELQAIQRAWSPDWTYGTAPLREVEVNAPVREVPPREQTGRVAAFFSGGVDSWATVLENPDLTDLIFVRGIDLLPTAPHQAELADEVEARISEVAGALGLTLHTVETNARELSDPLVPWEAYSATPLAATALFFEPLFDRVLIATDTDYATQPAINSAWTIDGLWSSERVEIVDDGGHLNREQRLALAVEHPEARRTLRVCWKNPGGAYNCGRCGKCMLTKLSLEAQGQRERVTSFAPGLDLSLLEGFEMHQPIQLILWEDALATARTAGREDLAAAAEGYVERGRKALGLPATHRFRRQPAVLVPSRTEQPPTLFATAETAAALAGTRSLALLVGSYDGSGNFGDIAQLDAALGLLAPFAPDLLALPLIERFHEDDHREAAAGMRHRPEHVLYFDADGRGGGDLVPVRPPAELAYAACYLYGGGYLNPLWGERKLAMLAAAEALVSAGGAQRIVRVASGLQVDAGWLAGLASIDRRQLRSFALLGSRDGGSEAALAELGPETVTIESGDDALGLLSDLPPATAPPASGPLRVNVHFATHEWVSPDPDAVLTLFAETLEALGELSGRPLTLQPLLAYLDSRTDDRPALERLRGACAKRGIELGEPLLLRPAELAAEAATVGRAELTLSCSYHASLTSLMAGVPALLLRDNPYYTQKAAGLAEAFALPPCFAPRSNDDPRALARDLLAATGGDAGAELRRGVELGAALLARRRREAEAAIVGRLAAGAFGVLGAGAGASSGAALLAAEARAAAAEQSDAAARAQLATVFASRTWRAAEPLRRAGRALRSLRAHR